MNGNRKKEGGRGKYASRQKETGRCIRTKTAMCLVLLSVFCMALLLAVKSGSIANAAEGTEQIEYKYYTTITVEKGETLWELALENYSEKYYDSVDDYVEEVKSINGLKGDTIHEGANLVIIYFSSEYK